MSELTVREAARLLDTTINQVYNLLWVNRLRGRKVKISEDGEQEHWLISEDSVKAYNARRKR